MDGELFVYTGTGVRILLDWLELIASFLLPSLAVGFVVDRMTDPEYKFFVPLTILPIPIAFQAFGDASLAHIRVPANRMARARIRIPRRPWRIRAGLLPGPWNGDRDLRTQIWGIRRRDG